MPKMKELAEILGVEIGEEFEITNYRFIYRITKQQVENRTRGAKFWSGTDGEAVYSVLTGRSRILKKPWKPKKYEMYWTTILCVCRAEWEGSTKDLSRFAAGNCFKTREDAESHRKMMESR